MEFEFLTGAAGTGKTTDIQNRLARAKAKGIKNYATLCATTGIAAINLSGSSMDQPVTTLNSLLGFFDTQSLKDAFASRKLHGTLKRIAKGSRKLIIDEISMQDKVQLDLIHDALEDINGQQEVTNWGGLGLVLVGDFMQLPPVKADYAFNADCWDKNVRVNKLTKVWRQDNLGFVEMLNAARGGDGEKTAEALCGGVDGITIRGNIDSSFDGTTIVPINKYVDSYNEVRLKELMQDKTNNVWRFPTVRWGKQRGEWKQIPEEIIVCKNAYVMILANDAPDFTYANGSCGHVRDANISLGTAFVKLKQGGKEVRVRKVSRKYFTKDTPEGCREPSEWKSKKDWVADYKEAIERLNSKQVANIERLGIGSSIPVVQDGATKISAAMLQGIAAGKAETVTQEIPEASEGTYDAMYKTYLIGLSNDLKKPGQPYYDFLQEKWVIGEIIYTPLRLAYASTVHKTQGLSLDAIQIDFSHAFFGEPSMAYVALSRCRTPEGLTVVGNRKLFEDRTNVSSEVIQWL